jgi:outer membrane lipoprotein-sorting protein
MNYRIFCVVVAAVIPCIAMTVDEVLDRMESNEKAKTSRIEMTQTVYGADGRETESKLVSYGMDEGDKGMMEYVEPARIKGMKILMLNEGDDIWFYSPRTSRVRKIASHQKNQSVNNSDFSYEDMSAGDLREDYTCALAGEEEVDGVKCHRIEMKAKSGDKSYSKIVFWVDKEKYTGVKGEFYDEKGELWKLLLMRQTEKIGAYWTPREVEMKNVQKGSRTVMKMDKVEYDIDLEKSMFSERYLKQ